MCGRSHLLQLSDCPVHAFHVFRYEEKDFHRCLSTKHDLKKYSFLLNTRGEKSVEDQGDTGLKAEKEGIVCSTCLGVLS